MAFFIDFQQIKAIITADNVCNFFVLNLKLIHGFFIDFFSEHDDDERSRGSMLVFLNLKLIHGFFIDLFSEHDEHDDDDDDDDDERSRVRIRLLHAQSTNGKINKITLHYLLLCALI